MKGGEIEENAKNERDACLLYTADNEVNTRSRKYPATFLANRPPRPHRQAPCDPSAHHFDRLHSDRYPNTIIKRVRGQVNRGRIVHAIRHCCSLGRRVRDTFRTGTNAIHIQVTTSRRSKGTLRGRRLRLDPCEELGRLLLRHQDEVLLQQLEGVPLGEPTFPCLRLVLHRIESLLFTV